MVFGIRLQDYGLAVVEIIRNLGPILLRAAGLLPRPESVSVIGVLNAVTDSALNALRALQTVEAVKRIACFFKHLIQLVRQSVAVRIGTGHLFHVTVMWSDIAYLPP
ncbi:hypothetical protein D1872_238490 [compost metagenome]